MKFFTLKAHSYLRPYLITAVIIFASLAAYLTLFSKAAPNSGFYLSPATSNITVGNTFAVQVRLNYSSAVDTVQTYISYSPNLEVIGLPTVVKPYDTDFENNTATAGLIKMQRSDFSDTPATGDRLISTLTFKAINNGPATVAFTDQSYGANQGAAINNIPKSNANYSLSGPTSVASPPASSTPQPSSSGGAPLPLRQANGSSSPQSASKNANQLSVAPSDQAGSVPQASPTLPSSTASEPVNMAGYTNYQPKPNQMYTASNKKYNLATMAAIIAGGIASLLLLSGIGAGLLLRQRGYHEGLFKYIVSLKKSDTGKVSGLIFGSAAENVSKASPVVNPSVFDEGRDAYKPTIITPTPSPAAPTVGSDPSPKVTDSNKDPF